MVLPAYWFEEWAKGALAAQGLGQKMEGVLRAALVEVVLGLAGAARSEKAGVRRGVLKEGGQRLQQRHAVQLRATLSSDGQRRDSQ